MNTKTSSRSWLICRKEFREIFRDRRTLMSVVIGPLFMTPALFGIMGLFIGRMTDRAKTEIYSIGVVGSEAAPGMIEELNKIPTLKFQPVPAAKAEQMVKERTVKAVLVLPEKADTALDGEQSVSVEILVDVGEQSSQIAAGRLKEIFNQMGKMLLKQRLEARRLPPDFAEPVKVREKPIESGGSQGTFVLSMMLPYILAISAFSGAIYAAFDQVAGEKERGTLETLLVSPASRKDIVLGKFAAVVGVCLLTGLLTVAGMAIAFLNPWKAFEWLSKGGLAISPSAIGVTLLVMIPLSVLFAGLLLTVSTFARNQKEAQTYLFPLMTFILMPAMASMFIGTDVEMVYALVPVLNVSVIIKQALSGSYHAGFIALAFAASLFYAGIALFVATRLFQKESVLLKA